VACNAQILARSAHGGIIDAVPDELPLHLHALVYREAGPGYQTKVHANLPWQWYCCIYGGVDYWLDGETLSLAPEQSVLIPPRAERSPGSRGKAPGYIYAMFDNRRLALDGFAGRQLAMPAELHPDLMALVDELRRSDGDEDLRAALLVRILIGLGRDAREDRSRPALLNAGSHREVVQRLEDFMRARLEQPLDRSALAEQAHLSPSQLARIFHAATGTSPMERLAELRIDRAKHLLLEGTLSIAQIAGRVGFGSASHFAKRFRALAGVSPSDYRRSDGHLFR